MRADEDNVVYRTLGMNHFVKKIIINLLIVAESHSCFLLVILWIN